MIKSIPFIKPDLPSLREVEKEFKEILGNGKITNFGKYATAFEEEAAAYLGGGVQVATTCNGTTGLILALQTMGIKPGKKVILPSMTFMATAQAVLYAGGTPIFAEIGDDYTLSVPDLQALLKRHKETAAVLAVHTYGLPCRVKEIQAAVDAANKGKSRGSRISVLYDAAHSFGSALKSGKVGTFGDAEVFSLSVTKTLVSVEGGMVASRDPELMRRVRKMRNYGIEANYETRWPGMNGKMSEFHAIIGLHNLRKLDGFLKARKTKAAYYMEQIRDKTRYQPPACPAETTHTFKDFTILLPDSMSGARAKVMDFLKARGIETRAYFYPPLHAQAYFKSFADRPLPVTDSIAARVITLPFFTTITNDEIDYIVSNLTESQNLKG